MQLTPKTEKDADENINDVEPLLVTNVNRKPPRKWLCIFNDKKNQFFGFFSLIFTCVVCIICLLHWRHVKSEAEFDDDEDDGSDIDRGQKGVDDGFFIDTRADDDDNVDKAHPTNTNGTRGNQPPSQEPPPNFPYAPGFNPNVVSCTHWIMNPMNGYVTFILFQIMDANGNPQVIPDINVYQQKKNLAQGMMDLALLSANANQLRYVLESYVRHPYYWFSLISITISLILQVIAAYFSLLISLDSLHEYNFRSSSVLVSF